MTSTNKIRDYPAYPFHGVNFSKITLTTLLPERKDRFGGPGRNRTDVQGFAILCITTLLPGHLLNLFRSDNFATMQVLRYNIDYLNNKLLSIGATAAF